jgi:hypothetical protein
VHAFDCEEITHGRVTSTPDLFIIPVGVLGRRIYDGVKARWVWNDAAQDLIRLLSKHFSHRGFTRQAHRADPKYQRLATLRPRSERRYLSKAGIPMRMDFVKDDFMAVESVLAADLC